MATLPGDAQPSRLLAGAADTGYICRASLGYSTTDLEHLSLPGPIDADAGAFGVGFDWHFLAPVENSEVPIALQALDQRSGSVRVDVGSGTVESSTDHDLLEWGVGATFVVPAGPVQGLGFEVDFDKTTVDGMMSTGYDTSVFRFGGLFYIPTGSALIPKAGIIRGTEEGGLLSSDLSGFDVGCEYYTAADRRGIDAELTLGFFSETQTFAAETDVFRLGLRVDYCPVKEVVFGIDWQKDSWDAAFTYEVTTLGIRGAYYLDRWVPGLGVKVRWSKENTLSGPDDYDNRTFSVTVDYRF